MNKITNLIINIMLNTECVYIILIDAESLAKAYSLGEGRVRTSSQVLLEISIHPISKSTHLFCTSRWATCLSSAIRESKKAFWRLSMSGLDWWNRPWCNFFFFFDQEGGTGIKKVIEAPTGGRINCLALASAFRSTLYLLYFSNLSNLLKPDGRNFSLGILKNMESP